MIQLHADFLAFEEDNGEAFLCAVEQMGVELLGDQPNSVDPHVLQHATQAILFYFKHELHRTTVTLGEFATALTTALHALGVSLAGDEVNPQGGAAVESNLPSLIPVAPGIYELAFFANLRAEMRGKIQLLPAVLRFTGLRACVKLLAGGKRWNHRCQRLEDYILWFLRQSYRHEVGETTCLLVVE